MEKIRALGFKELGSSEVTNRDTDSVRGTYIDSEKVDVPHIEFVRIRRSHYMR